MLDIDHFKQVNDTYGHAIGDKVLVALAEVMRGSLRKLDSVVRYGGEEFVVLMPEVTAEQAFAASERLRKDVEKICVPSDQGDVHITISIGVTGIYEEMDVEFEALMKQADDALYKAKNKGRNQTVMWKSSHTDNFV
jgi:diguanylate cyclase (GGDEF)-like protein